jgi:hypothetical protein
MSDMLANVQTTTITTSEEEEHMQDETITETTINTEETTVTEPTEPTIDDKLAEARKLRDEAKAAFKVQQEANAAERAKKLEEKKEAKKAEKLAINQTTAILHLFGHTVQTDAKPVKKESEALSTAKGWLVDFLDKKGEVTENNRKQDELNKVLKETERLAAATK